MDDGEAKIKLGLKPLLTVAIPSRDRPTVLGETLSTLAETHAGQPLEVLVIDDASAPPYDVAIARAPWPLHVVRATGAGLNAARNRAMAQARTDWVAFLDDDVYVARGWGDALIAAQARREISGVAGRIMVRYEGPVPTWLDEDEYAGYLSKLDFGPEPRVGKILPFGANFAVTKRAWESVGGFFHGADRVGRSLISGGETEFFQALVDRGAAILYEPGALVHHRFSGDRLTYEYFARRAFGQGVTDAIIDGGDGGGWSELRTLARGLRLAAIAELNRTARRRTAITDSIWRQYAYGQLSGALRQRGTRRALAHQRSSTPGRRALSERRESNRVA